MIVGDMEIRLRADIARLQRDMDAGRRVVSNATESMSRAANAAKAALAGIAAGMGMSQIIQMTDQYAKFTAQLRLASLSAREYAAAYTDVRRISTVAQQDLQATGMLYARIANGTRELGTTQKQVAAITETVNLALKVSGATASESASAQLQLSQAFASGTLRGEEFNAVNEAAPRLMLALADGIGVPVGALKKMAEEGKITSKIMADVLPSALARLRVEAQEVQTIAGAFTVLKNNVMEFVGMQANANGGVAALTGAIGLLASNLGLLAGVLLTVMAAKLGTWLAAVTTQTYASIVANRALLASNLATAQAQVAASGAASALAAARVVELRAAVLAAQGQVALAITTNGLIPAQARAAAAAATHAAALVAQTTAMRAASVAGGILRGALAFLGGPIGAVITLLGIAATAWMVWGNKAKESNDKALESVDETTTEMIARLDKQIEKLRERNRLQDTEPRLKSLTSMSDADQDGLARAKARLDANRAGTGEWTGQSIGMRQLGEIELAHAYETALKRVGEAQDEVTRAATRGRDVKLADWYGQNGTKAQKLAAELEKLRKEFGSIPPEMEKMVRAKYADKGAATALNQEASAYTTLITSIKEKIAAGQQEIDGHDKLTESQKMTIKLDAEIATGKSKLSLKHVEEARAMIATVGAQEKAIAAKNAADEVQKRFTDGATNVWEQVRALEGQIAAYGLVSAAVVELDRTKVQSQLLSAELSAEEAAALEMKLAGLDRLRERQAQYDSLPQGTSLQQAKDLLEILVQVDEATKSAADGMAASFGRVGSAIGGLTTALSGYARTQQAITAQLAAVKDDKRNSPEKVAQAEIFAAKASAQARIKSYGDMAGAAKGFFKENSTGYKVMEGAEKAFRAVEMAMAIQTMLTKSGLLTAFTGLFVASKATQSTAEVGATGISVAAAGAEASAWGVTAVVKAIASMPFPANLAAGAATLAAVVAIGAKMMGGVSGGSASVSEQRQKTQGTGSVFGASDSKSNSIARSLELAASNSSIELNYTAGMLNALRNIESALSGLGNLLVRGSGLTGAMQADTKSSLVNFVEGAGSALTLTKVLDSFTNGFFSKMSGKITNAVFGGNVTTLDTGITASRGSLGSMLAGGISTSQYTDTKKDGGWFGSDKYRTALTGLGAEADSQFTKVISNMAEAVKIAGGLLGQSGDAFNRRMNSFIVDIGKISLKGLSGEQIQKELEAVFSKLGDDMARFAVGGLAQFQQVGEGYLETLVRISTNYANLDATLQSIGMTFGATGISSIAARENLIALVGGIDELASYANSFATNYLTEAERLAPVQKYVAEQMSAMGMASIDTRDEFKALVLGLDLTSDAGQKQYAALMQLEGAFAKVHAATKDLTKSEQAIADERADLQKRFDQLTKTSAQLRAMERAEIDATNRPLYDHIIAREDLVEAYDRESSAMKALADNMKSAQASTLAYKDSLALGNLSTLTPLQKAAEAQRQYDASLAKVKANPNDAAAYAASQAAANAFLTASQVVNASGDAQVAAVSRVQADMALLASLAGNQMTEAQQQLSVMDKQYGQLVTLNQTVLSFKDALVNVLAIGPDPIAGPTPAAFNYSGMGTLNMAPLTEEIKALNAKLAAQTAVIEGLRADQKKQTGDMIKSNADVTMQAAAAGTEGAKQAYRDAAWAEQSAKEIIK